MTCFGYLFRDRPIHFRHHGSITVILRYPSKFHEDILYRIRCYAHVSFHRIATRIYRCIRRMISRHLIDTIFPEKIQIIQLTDFFSRDSSSWGVFLLLLYLFFSQMVVKNTLFLSKKWQISLPRIYLDIHLFWPANYGCCRHEQEYAIHCSEEVESFFFFWHFCVPTTPWSVSPTSQSFPVRKKSTTSP